MLSAWPSHFDDVDAAAVLDVASARATLSALKLRGFLLRASKANTRSSSKLRNSIPDVVKSSIHTLGFSKEVSDSVHSHLDLRVTKMLRHYSELYALPTMSERALVLAQRRSADIIVAFEALQSALAVSPSLGDSMGTAMLALPLAKALGLSGLPVVVAVQTQLGEDGR